MAFIGRSADCSPNSVDQDADILTAVRRSLEMQGVVCEGVVPEEKLWVQQPSDTDGQPQLLQRVDAIVSMGRKAQTLSLLDTFERTTGPVVNTVQSVRTCNQRASLMQQLETAGIAVPPSSGVDGYWVKRGDGCAETEDDVQYASDRKTAEALSEAMLLRGVRSVDVRAHVVGDLVKFYGVRGTSFFYCCYPTDDGKWKFADERHNGAPHHYPFDEEALKMMMGHAADLIGLDVYGGDCIIRPDGQPVLIDLNDWPSFSRCRDAAAEAIAQRIVALTVDSL